MSEIVPLKKKVNTVRELLESRKSQIQLALPKHLTADRLLSVALYAMVKNPRLLDCTQAWLLGAVLESAALGLELGERGEAHLVPYGKKATLIIGYLGLLALARRSGLVGGIQVRVVHEKDHFRYAYGLNPVLEHTESDENDRGKITHVWACAEIRGGGMQWEVMRKAEVDAIKAKSPAAKRSDSPWQTHYEAMMKKTVLRQLCKLLPSSVEMQRAVHLDELADVGIPQDLGGMIDVTPPQEDQEPNPEEQPPADPCGKVLDDTGTACGLEKGHVGSCEPF